MSDSNLFSPKTTGTVSITCAITSSPVALVIKGAQQLAITNSDASNIAYVEVGTSSVTATVPNGAIPGSMPILPGQTRGISIAGSTVTHAAAICSAGTPLVFFTPGNGA